MGPLPGLRAGLERARKLLPLVVMQMQMMQM